MIVLEITRSRLFAGSLTAALAACSGGEEAGPNALDADQPSASDLDGGTSSPVEDAASNMHPTSFAVTIESDKVEVCPGECAELSISTSSSEGELSYAWDQGLPPQGSQRVCLEATTSYAVNVVQRIAPGSEFEAVHSADDQLTISVRSCEPESPILCEMRHRFDLPTAGNLLRANKPWAAVLGHDSSIAADETGNVFLLGGFGHRIDLGAGEVTAKSGLNSFLHKLDKECNPVWTRALAATTPSDVLIPLALSTDKNGNVYTGTMGGPLLSFDPLVPFQLSFVTELVVQKFSPEGEELYRSAFPVGPGMIQDLVVDDQGRVYIAGLMSAITDFGGGPLGLIPTSVHAFVLALDERGRHRATKTNTGFYKFTKAGDQLVFRTYSTADFDLFGALLGAIGMTRSDPAVASLGTANLTERWRTPINLSQGYVDSLSGLRDGSSVALIQHSTSESTDTELITHNVLRIARYDASGAVTRYTDAVEHEDRVPMDDAGVPDLNLRSHPHVRLLETSPQGEVALAGHYYADFKVGNVVLRAEPAVATQGQGSTARRANIMVIKLDRDDKLSWLRSVALGENPGLHGLAMDSEGHVWVSGRGDVPGTRSPEKLEFEQDLVVTKLRGSP